MKRSTSIMQSFMLYAGTALVFRGIGIILTPLYMRLFSPSAYGALSLIESFVYICTTLMGVGLRKLLALEYVHHDARKQKELTNAIIVTHLFLAIPILALMVLLRKTILSVVFNNSITTPIFIFVVLITLCSFFCELLYQLMRFNHQARALSLIHLFHALSISTLTLAALYIFDLGLLSIPAAQGITMLIIALLGGMIWYKNQYAQSLDIKNTVHKMHHYLGRSVPLTVGVLLQWVLESGDRWMLARYSSMHEVGIYSAAYLFNGIVYALVVLPWVGAYVPAILQHYARNKTSIPQIEQKNQRYMWYSMLGLITLIIIGALVLKGPLLWLLPTSYHHALPLMIPMMIGRSIYFGAQWNLCLLQFSKKVTLLNWVFIPPILISLGCNYVFIPLYGAYASSIISCASFSVYFCMTWYYNRVVQATFTHASENTL
jgi:O-antigen/teichoic acid export membrane protein